MNHEEPSLCAVSTCPQHDRRLVSFQSSKTRFRRAELRTRHGSRLQRRRAGLSGTKCANSSACTCPSTLREKVLNFKRLTREDLLSWHRTLHARGWSGPSWPAAYRRPGWSAIEQHIFDEECSAAGAPPLVAFSVRMVAPVLMAYGSPAQQQYFLPRILSGEHWWCQGYTEPDAGLRPRFAQDARRTARRSLRRERPEDLEHARPLRRLDLLSRAHVDRRATAAGNLASAHRHEDSGYQRPPDRAHRRRTRSERDLVRQR